MINEKTKHIELRNKIESMLNEGLCLKDISIKLDKRIGHQRDRGSIKWFSKCISSKKNMEIIHRIHYGVFTRKRLNLDESQIKELYLIKELPPYKIAKIIKCDTMTVFHRLRKMGITTRSYIESRKVKTYAGVRKIKNTGFTLEKAYILGVLCGDAYISAKKYRVGLRAIDLDFILEFQRNMEKAYGICGKIRKVKPKNKNWNIQYLIDIYSKLVYEDISSYGNFDTDNWRIPKEIFYSLDKNIIGYFLRGFYDSEGHVNSDNYILKATTSNKEGFSDILNLLNRLNIHYITKLKKHDNPKYKLGYEVLITGSDSYKSFKDIVGFSIKRKQDALLKLQNIRKQKRYTKSDFENVIKLREKGLHQAEISRRTGVIHSTISKWFRNEEHYSKILI